MKREGGGPRQLKTRPGATAVPEEQGREAAFRTFGLWMNIAPFD